MALRTAGSVLVVFLWSVAVVLSQNGWSVTYTTQSICTLKGSSVEMSCSYTYPRGYIITTTFWFITNNAEGKPVSLSGDPDYKGRVTYRSDKMNGHTLTITDLRESDSATYMFSFITDQTRGRYPVSPGVTLSVTDLQVKVTPTWRATSTTLTCSTTSCPLTGNPTYIWYKNGQVVTENTLHYSVYPEAVDSYFCAVKDHEDLHSPAVCVQGQRCSRVNYTNRSICALKGSTVDISCTYVGYYYTKSSFWFRSDKLTPENLTRDPGYAGRVEYTGTNRGPFTLRISDLREEDTAEYRFTFKTYSVEWGHSFPGTSLTVTDLQVKVTPGTVTEGSWVTLTCITTCTLIDIPNPTYIWYKNGEYLFSDSSPQYQYSVSRGGSDSYSCALRGHDKLSSPGVTVDTSSLSCLRVTYTSRSICSLIPSVDLPCTTIYPTDGPKNTSVSVSPSGELVEGSSVTLTCSSDANPPVDKYTWYKKNVTSPKASGQSYNITNIISEDRGEYYCEAENIIASNNSTALMIIVAGKQTSVVTAAVGIIVVVLVLILCLSGLMWFRKKASKPTNTRDTSDDGQGDSSPVYDNISNMAMTSTAAQTADTDNQDDVHYASVHFSGSKNQEVPLYSTVQLHQPQKQDQDVQYAAVKFNLPSSATQPAAAQAAEVDASEIYSTVNKPRTKKT
ncbi:B-cell receptor CD22-like isoform X4 [Oncorhynchus masou masou]|uniref:B-cell receptor CD22-like isoform X4 n=1 Tax=Oncorhynchus masou masou TaxID=90313 RepID=UPI0031830406